MTAGIVAFTSLSADHVQKLGEDLDKARAEKAQEMDQGDVTMDLIVPTHFAGLTRVFSFMSNYRSA